MIQFPFTQNTGDLKCSFVNFITIALSSPNRKPGLRKKRRENINVERNRHGN